MSSGRARAPWGAAPGLHARPATYLHRAMSGTATMTEIPYTVRRSPRARRVRVNVHAHTGVEVVLPQRAPERAAAVAVGELRPWIERRLAEARDVRRQVAARAGTVPYLGTSLALLAQPGRTRVH